MFLTREGLVGLDPANGQVRFQRPWRARQAASVNAATPVVVGNSIFVSAEYGPGAGVLQFDGAKLTDVWLSNEVLVEPLRDQRPSTRAACTDFTGARSLVRCSAPSTCRRAKCCGAPADSAPARVTLAGNRLLIVRESGELVLAAASPTAFQQVATAQVLPATVRAYPALADGMLYLRNDDTLIAGSAMKRFSVLGSGFWVLVLGSLVLWFACGVFAAQSPQAMLDRAVDEFEQGRFARLRPRSTSSRR